MTMINGEPRISTRQVRGGVPSTILDSIKMLDPLDPNKETAPSAEAGTVLDSYVPIGEPEEDPNENCYWDKKVIKEKRELEQSVARMQAKSRVEALEQNEAALSEKAAESAARRSGSPGDGLGYYAFFK